MRNVKGTWIYTPSQTDLLLEHFRSISPHITPLEANKVYGIERLAGRIWDLKQMGYVFTTQHKRDALGKKYVEYNYLGRETTYGAMTLLDVGGGF